MLEVVFKITCSKCGKSHEDVFPVNLGFPLIVPPIPYGWHNYDQDYICDKHVVGIMDKVSVKE